MRGVKLGLSALAALGLSMVAACIGSGGGSISAASSLSFPVTSGLAYFGSTPGVVLTNAPLSQACSENFSFGSTGTPPRLNLSFLGLFFTTGTPVEGSTYADGGLGALRMDYADGGVKDVWVSLTASANVTQVSPPTKRADGGMSGGEIAGTYSATLVNALGDGGNSESISGSFDGVGCP
jgi:hypothetical protein